jgi:hypothetical protein
MNSLYQETYEKTLMEFAVKAQNFLGVSLEGNVG